MHKLLVDNAVEVCRKRKQEGDCIITPSLSIGLYEEAIVTMAAELEELRDSSTLPKGWRWLELGEETNYGDFCCDPRAAPVRITEGTLIMNERNHPVSRRST